MKKIIIASLAFVLLFTGVKSVLASGPFNGQSGDCPSIAIGNYTTGVGIGDGQWNCWTRQSVSASAGDTINVALFYHNNTSSTLTNVEASLSQSSNGPTTNYSFGGQMYSDQGNTTLGTVNLSLNSSQTLTYSSAHWMKDKYAIDSDTDSAMLYGQDGSVMKNGGRIRLGSAPSGWNDYGYIIVVFKVGNTVDNICRDTSASNYLGTLPCTYPQQLCKDTSATNYNGPLPCTYPQLCKDPSASNYNGSLPCQYPAQLCRDVSASNYLGALPCQYPAQLCRDTSATNYLGALPCRYQQVYNTCRIINFDADDTSIEEGDTVRLTWDTENCTSVSISGVSSGLSRSGNYRVTPSSTRTYVLNAYGNNGSDSESVRIYVNDNNNNNNDTCRIDSFTASNTYINAGGSTRLNWDTTNCSSTSISYLGNVNRTGSQTVYPINNTNYILTAYGSNSGVQTRSVYVTVNAYVPVTPVNNCAVTTLATNISQTGAQLNGLVSGGSGANTFFEYGTTVNMGQRTVSRYSTAGTNFSDFVTGLSSNTIYYFRMNSDCQGGLSQGSIEIFRTSAIAVAGQTVKTVYIQQGTTVVGTSSPVLLNISNRYELIAEGDLVDYVVTYKNISKTKLLKPMIQVVLPTNITLVNASRGAYSVDTHTLSAQIEDLNAGEEGIIFLQGKVDSIPLNNSKIATTAILIYTAQNGSQENAMAYVINIPKVIAVEVAPIGSVLGGSAFLGGLLSIGLVGWLLIILLILLAILIARSYSRRTTSDSVTHTTHTTSH